MVGIKIADTRRGHWAMAASCLSSVAWASGRCALVAIRNRRCTVGWHIATMRRPSSLQKPFCRSERCDGGLIGRDVGVPHLRWRIAKIGILDRSPLVRTVARFELGQSQRLASVGSEKELMMYGRLAPRHNLLCLRFHDVVRRLERCNSRLIGRDGRVFHQCTFSIKKRSEPDTGVGKRRKHGKRWCRASSGEGNWRRSRRRSFQTPVNSGSAPRRALTPPAPPHSIGAGGSNRPGLQCPGDAGAAILHLLFRRRRARFYGSGQEKKIEAMERLLGWRAGQPLGRSLGITTADPVVDRQILRQFVQQRAAVKILGCDATARINKGA